MATYAKRRSQSAGQRIRVRGQAPPNRIGIEVTTPDGRHRWHPSDPTAETRPQDLACSWIQPGGDDELTTILRRRPGEDFPDTERLNTVRVYGPGNETLAEHLITQPSRSWGELQVQITAKGWHQVLDWNPNLRMPYVDRNLSHWQGFSRARKVAHLATTNGPTDPTVEADVSSGLPAIHQQIEGAWPASRLPIVESWYDAGSNTTIGSIYYDFVASGDIASPPAADWTWRLGSADDDIATNVNVSSDLATASTGSGTFTPSTSRRWGLLQMFYGVGPAGADGARYLVAWRRVAVFANHSLTKYGTAPDEGYLGSDILNHGLTSLAVPLEWTTGSVGTLLPTDHVIQHFVIGREQPATARQLIEGLNRFEGRAWGVHKRELFWRAKGSGRKWRLRRSQVSFSEEGASDESAYNGVIVYYRDPAGVSKVVGPPGAAADNTDSNLEDTSETNPVNERGLGRKWLPLQVDVVTTLAGATRLGEIALAEITRPTRGSARVVGLIEDERGGLAWPWAIRDDDVVSFADEIGGPERIVTQSSYSHASGEAQVELDGPEGRLDVIIARLEDSIAGFGLS